jgi:Tfp pilus assembly protein PilN
MTTQASVQKLTTWASDASGRLRKVGEFAWRILNLSLGDDAVSSKRTISISIEKSGVSIADGSRFLSRIRIRNVRQYPSEEGRYPAPDYVARIVSLAMREFRARNAEICLGIPKTWAVIKTVELPSSVRENLPDVISYELDRLTPFSPDDALYDFRIVDENPEKLRIVLGAAKADVINPYVQALQAKGIRTDRVHINLSGMAALLGIAGQGTEFIFLEIDEDEFEAALIRNGSVSSVLADRHDGSDDESIIVKALNEIAPFIERLRSDGKPPRLVVHLKGNLRDRGFALLEQSVTIPYRVLNDLDLKLEIPARGKNIPYAALGGALESLWPQAARMNFLEKGRHPDSRRPVAATVVLGVAALCAGLFYMASPIEIEGKRVEELDRQISLRKDEVAKVEAIRKEVDGISREIASINNFKTGKPMAMDIIRELTSILPKNAWLSRVRVTDTGIDIEGYTSGSAAELLPTLEASTYLQKVEFSSPTFRDARMNADRFVIKMETESATDEGGRSKAENKK